MGSGGKQGTRRSEGAGQAGREETPRTGHTEKDAASLCGRAFSAGELADLAGLGADWLWETDRDHRFTWISEDFETHTGIEPERLIGRSRLDVVEKVAITSEDAEAHMAVLEAREPVREFVYELKQAKTEGRWVSATGFPRFDEDGAFAGYRGIGRNVTRFLGLQDELRQARRELSLSEGRARVVESSRDPDGDGDALKAALEVMREALCYYDKDDRLVLYNQAMVDMYAGMEDLIRPGMTYEALVDAGLERGLWETGDVDRETWRKAALGRRRKRIESEAVLQFADGRFVMRRERPTEDGGTIALLTDITELKQHEAEIEAARHEAEAARTRLQAAINALKDGFVLWDGDDRLVACNDAFRRQFSFLPNLAEGRTFSEMFIEFARSGIVPEAVGREEEWVAEHAGKRAEELDQEVVFQTHDGRWMMRRDQLTESGDRVGIRTDVTEHKRHEEELAREKARSEEILSDLELTVDAMRMAVVVLDGNLEASIINKAYHELWQVTPQEVPVGSSARTMLEIGRRNGAYDIADEDWESYVEARLEEVRAGDVAPREFRRADGRTMIYSVTSLSGGRRLLTYYDISGMKDREARLGEALEKSRLAEAVIDSVPNPIFVKDANLDFVLANAAFADIFGLKPEDMIGRKGGDFVSPEEAEQFETSERGVLETGEKFEVEEDFEFSGIGRTRIVRKNRVTTDHGNDYVACSIFDVSEMKQRERDVEEARLRLASVLESLPAGVIIYDRDDRFVLANRKIHEALPAMMHAMQPGRPLRDAVEAAHDAGYFRESGDPELDRIYDSDRDGWIDGYVKRYQARHNVFERKNPDGRWFQAFDTRTEDGTFVGVRVDITDLKERETALQQSMQANEVFQSLIDNLPVAIYAKHDDLRLKYVNQGWCDLMGHTREEAIGRTDADIFGADGETFMEGDRAVLKTGETQEIEEEWTASDGEMRYQIARKSSMIASDGSLYLIGSTTDVTEQRRREEELREARQKAVLADRAKTEFLANMSHEIRTPMNGVLGMAELLAKTELAPKQKTFTDIIAKSGNALLTIINDILDFSKIDAGQLVLDPAPFDLAEAIEDVATLVSTRAKEKDLEMIVRVDPRLPTSLVGDVGRIRQIITNLLGNAVKFTEKGHVLVDVSGEPGDAATRVNFSVTDTGIGIPKDKLELVFDKFSQVDSSSTRKHEGTGLGLAIMSRLVELMGGEVGVESTEGKGSTFWFTVTLPHAKESGRDKVTPIDVTGARVLVVDDNAVNRSILSEQMNSWGFDSCAARDGAEGLKVLDAAARFNVRVDCVVLDYQMPGMSGLDMAREVRATEAIADTPIIMLTSVQQTISSGSSRDLSIAAQLTKPARSSALLEALVVTIQNSRSGEAEKDEADDPSQAPIADARESDGAGDAPPPAGRPSRSAEARPEAAVGEHRIDILVAEDNEVNQLVFTQILGETGLSFEIVGNGRQAVESCAQMRPRMILMDVSMPEMNGLEATAAIRQSGAETGRVPIIGVTAHALKGDRERCLDAGMDDYLSKPISPKALLEKVERWAGHKPGDTRRGAG